MQLPALNAEEMLKLVRFSMMYPYAGSDVSWPRLQIAARYMKLLGYSVAEVLEAFNNALSFWLTHRKPMIPDPFSFVLYTMPLFLPKKPRAFSC